MNSTIPAKTISTSSRRRWLRVGVCERPDSRLTSYLVSISRATTFIRATQDRSRHRSRICGRRHGSWVPAPDPCLRAPVRDMAHRAIFFIAALLELTCPRSFVFSKLMIVSSISRMNAICLSRKPMRSENLVSAWVISSDVLRSRQCGLHSPCFRKRMRHQRQNHRSDGETRYAPAQFRQSRLVLFA